MTINNQYELEQEAKEIAKMAMIEKREFGTDPSDYIHQACDGHECVIYTYKAGLLCLECDTHDGENYLEDMGCEFNDYADHVTKLAYATLAVAAMNAFYDLIESKAA